MRSITNGLYYNFHHSFAIENRIPKNIPLSTDLFQTQCPPDSQEVIKDSLTVRYTLT